MKRLIILHCFGRTSQERWYQSVKNSLRNQFEKIETPDMPHPNLGNIEEWLPALEALSPDTTTVLVGHSLGATLILRYLEQANRHVASYYLVAGPINDLAQDDLHATGFFEQDFNWEQIKSNCPIGYCLASKDDDTVPFWQAEKIAAETGAALIPFEDKGHFRQDEFPELVELIISNLSKEKNV